MISDSHCEWISSLQGETGKMSASDPNSAIYVTDSAKDIKNKVCECCISYPQLEIFWSAVFLGGLLCISLIPILWPWAFSSS